MDTSEGQKPGQREKGAELIGSYGVMATIARSELTTVYLAQKHGTLGFSRLAAIKRLNASFPDQAGGVQLLLDEARLSAGVRHANVVDVIDVGTDGGCHLVMDYIEGADLEALLLRAGKERHPRFVVPPIVDALHGLDAVHGALDELGQPLSMVHQAPRARHILIGIDGTARVTDFSQVAARGLLPSNLRANRLRAEYMAPEQLLGSDATARSDLFIVGVALWEALTGERLFQADTRELSRRAVLQRSVLKPSEVGLKPPRCFDAICLRALARNPDQRYESALEMARALRDAALNEALYATSAELGQWVRALAGRALIERRRALGADAPSLELGIDVFGEAAEATREIDTAALRSSETSDAPAPVGSTRERSEVEARASARERSEAGAAPREREDIDAGAIPSEGSRVARSTTVPGLGAPKVELPAHPPSAAPAPAGFPAPSATLLGLGGRIGRASPPRDFTPTPPGAKRDPVHPGPGSYSRVAADRRNTSANIHSQPTVPVPRVSWQLANPAGELESGPSGAFRKGVRRDALPGRTDESGQLAEATREPEREARSSGREPEHEGRESEDGTRGSEREHRARSAARARVAERSAFARGHSSDEEAAFDSDVDSLQPPGWGARTRPPPEATPTTLGLRILTAVLVTIIVMAALVGLRQAREPNRELTRSTASRPMEHASEAELRERPHTAGPEERANSTRGEAKTGAAADPGETRAPVDSRGGEARGSVREAPPDTAESGAAGAIPPVLALPVEPPGRPTGTPNSSANTPVASPAGASGGLPSRAGARPAAPTFAPIRAAAAGAPGAAVPRPAAQVRPAGPALKRSATPVAGAPAVPPSQPASPPRPAAQPPARSPSAPAWQMHTPGLPENPY